MLECSMSHTESTHSLQAQPFNATLDFVLAEVNRSCAALISSRVTGYVVQIAVTDFTRPTEHTYVMCYFEMALLPASLLNEAFGVKVNGGECAWNLALRCGTTLFRDSSNILVSILQRVGRPFDV